MDGARLSRREGGLWLENDEISSQQRNSSDRNASDVQQSRTKACGVRQNLVVPRAPVRSELYDAFSENTEESDPETLMNSKYVRHRVLP